MSAGTLPTTPAVSLLRHGERLSREEFERRYEATPEKFKAELLDGVVYVMSSPVTAYHATPHFNLISWLGAYCLLTPGVEGGDNGTMRLPHGSDPQPDAFLRVLEAHGGRSWIDADGFVAGVPDWLEEVSLTTTSYDRTVKLPIYQRDGVPSI